MFLGVAILVAVATGAMVAEHVFTEREVAKVIARLDLAGWAEKDIFSHE